MKSLEIIDFLFDCLSLEYQLEKREDSYIEAARRHSDFGSKMYMIAERIGDAYTRMENEGACTSKALELLADAEDKDVAVRMRDFINRYLIQVERVEH